MVLSRADADLELRTVSRGYWGSGSQSRSKNETEHRTCCACGEPIADRFLLEVGGGAWHTGCLRCCVCAVQLDRHPSCFLRDRQVYCKQDYANHISAPCAGVDPRRGCAGARDVPPTPRPPQMRAPCLM
ncbi:hypothetical protein SFRURICE_008833 [Spodoptera frugiperda]|uniref:SFRICE_007020 n=1 Tax=Spodoptera frugiperda TaxID=7108 RepID=A0A2H1VKA8_SPOFR|nr:hypothetical protein SFRURICE_008833 [Spodoptera frugiperda]